MRLFPDVSALRSTISFWIAIAHSTAATMEGNSSSTPSPVVLTMRPLKLATIGRATSRCSRTARTVPISYLVLAHEPRIADHVGGEDGSKSTGGGHSGSPAL